MLGQLDISVWHLFAKAFAIDILGLMNCHLGMTTRVLLAIALLTSTAALAADHATPVNRLGQSAKKSAASKEDRPLDALIAGATLWDTTTDLFETQFKSVGLQWLSANKDQARFFGEGLNAFGGELKVLEAIAEFQSGKLARVNLSLFNRGDSGSEPANVAQFEAQVTQLKNIISSHLGVKAVDRGKDASSAVKALGVTWSKDASAYLLEYSYQKEVKSQNKEFRPEFIRLRVAPLPKQTLLGSAPTANKPVAKATLTSNITKETNGDIVIKTVPMVDQGPKGYCAVATAERVFKYYGLAVDQHEMAAVANTTDGGGTSPTQMFGALKLLTGRLKVHIRELQGWNYGDFSKMITDYNRAAKRNKKTEINLAGMRVIDIGEIYSSMDPESLKESKATPGKPAFGQFQRAIGGAINKGVPLMWSVQLGMFKEAEIPQARGGHMRLIIGYNTQTNEVLYSDSWGAAHALKRMPMDEACAMTTGLYYIEPTS
jgi:hypothetical protein